MTGFMMRHDRLGGGGGSMSAVWGVRIEAGLEPAQETLVAVYATEKERSEVGAAYEVSVFLLAPKEKIDFSQNIFNQPRLAPVVPALSQRPFHAASEDDAIRVGNDIARRLIEGEQNEFCTGARVRILRPVL